MPPKLYRCPAARCSSRSRPIREHRNSVNRILTPSGGTICRSLSITDSYSSGGAVAFPLQHSWLERLAATARLSGFASKLNPGHRDVAQQKGDEQESEKCLQQNSE